MAEPVPVLSPRATERMAAALPALLHAVRARRRRRHARRAVTVVLLACAPFAAWWGNARTEPQWRHEPVVAPQIVVATDPTVLARCEVRTVDRAEWYVDDAELQALLRADDREAGLVRIGDRVLVSKSAVDPLPAALPQMP